MADGGSIVCRSYVTVQECKPYILKKVMAFFDRVSYVPFYSYPRVKAVCYAAFSWIELPPQTHPSYGPSSQ